jgi:hypothetical protein
VIDWSPHDMLIPYMLLTVSVEHAAHGYLIEEYLRSLGFFRTDALCHRSR